MSHQDAPGNSRWSARNYGSRRGMITTLWHQLLNATGYYDSYKTIDWTRVSRLVFVCKGNICRSAYAEALAHDLGIDSISFGLDTVDDAPANSDAITAANKLAVNLDQHRTTTSDSVSLFPGDLLIAMEPWQVDKLKTMFDDQYQYSLLGLWAKPAQPHIQDPYGSSPAYFEKCFLGIRKAMYQLSEKIPR